MDLRELRRLHVRYNRGMAQTKKDTQLLNAYLIVGEDELKRETVMRRLRQRLEKMGDLAFNSDTFNGESASGDAIVAACQTLPFASDVRLVQVNNVEKLKKADQELLIDYLSDPNRSTILALVAVKLAKNTRLYKAVARLGKTAVIDCAPFGRKELNAAVRSMAVSHGVTFTPGASAALIDLVGTNTVALDSEIRKIALAHRGTDPVTDGEVMASVSRTAEIKPWEFVDAFSARNAKRCIYLLHRMNKTSPYGLLSMCVTRIRELLSVQALVARGNIHAIPKVLNVPEWKVKSLRQWAEGFSQEELISALKCARDTELIMKSGSDPDNEFLSWLLTTIERVPRM